MNTDLSTPGSAGPPVRLAPGIVAALSGTFVVGYMIANVVPLLISAMATDLGLDVVTAGTFGTVMLLCTAASGTVLAQRVARPARYRVARVGLVVMAAGSFVAAFVPVVWLALAGVVLAGVGAGAGIAAGGAAISATRDPDRTSGLLALINRLLAAVLLLVVPLIGLGMAAGFGTLGVLAVVGAVLAGRLPDSPVVDAPATAPTGARGATDRVGVVLVAATGLWAFGEDSLWAISSTMGMDQSGMTAQGIGVLLSVSTAAGLFGVLVVTAVGGRFGRVAPLTCLLVLGAATKLVSCLATDPAVFSVAFTVWNAIYAATFVYLVALAADVHPSGRWAALAASVYLFGSGLSPIFGAVVSERLGYATFGVVLAAFSLVLMVPLLGVARTVGRRANPVPAEKVGEQPA